jgi:hypothetical protein
LIGSHLTARAVVALLLAPTAIFVLSACTSPPEPVPTQGSAVPLAESPITDNMVRCLADEGWEVQRSIYGGFDAPQSLPASQATSYQSATDGCAALTGWATPLSDFTDAQRHELYAQEVLEHACLEELGYPGEEPPSAQAHVDSFASADQYYAFLAIADLPQGQFESAIQVCPPPTWFLNISGF